jgi:hypothetical protein
MRAANVSTCGADMVGPELETAAATSIECLLNQGRRALDEDGDPQAGRDWFEAAYRAAEASGDPVAMGEAAVGLAGLWVHGQRTTAAHALTLERLRRALAGVDPDSPLGLRLRLRLTAEVDYGSGASVATLALAEEVRHNADVLARAEAANLAHECVLGPDHTALRHTLADQLITDGIWHDRRGDLLMGLMWRTVDLLLDGDPRAERSLRELRTTLAGQQHRAVRSVVDAIDVLRHIRAGQLGTAEARAGDAARRDRLAGDANVTRRHALQLVAVRWYQGRLGELAPMLGDLVDSPDVGALDGSCLAAVGVGMHQPARRTGQPPAFRQLPGRAARCR